MLNGNSLDERSRERDVITSAIIATPWIWVQLLVLNSFPNVPGSECAYCGSSPFMASYLPRWRVTDTNPAVSL